MYNNKYTNNTHTYNQVNTVNSGRTSPILLNLASPPLILSIVSTKLYNKEIYLWMQN